MDDYRIRPMREDDWNQVHEIEQEIFKEDLLREDHFINKMQKGNFFALEIDGQIVGELHVARFGADAAHLSRIGVTRSHQRQGWGKVLMQHAIDWYKNEGDIVTVHLYTQDHNVAAQSLYKEFGFEVTGTTWHYIIPFASLDPKGEYSCQAIEENEIEPVAEMFPSLPAAQIRKFLEEDQYHVLTLKDSKGKIVGATRFTPSFPGSFPFEIMSIDCFDDFMLGMEQISLPEFDHMRIVFTDNKKWQMSVRRASIIYITSSSRCHLVSDRNLHSCSQ